MGTYIITDCDQCACLIATTPAHLGLREARKNAKDAGTIYAKIDGWNAVVCSEKCLTALKARYRRSK